MPNLIKKVLANVTQALTNAEKAALATTLIQQAGNLPTDTSGNITIGAEIERIL